MKTMITVMALLSWGISGAQVKDKEPQYRFTKGDLFIEGQLSFGTGKMNVRDEADAGRVTESNVSFSPKTGYFITDKFVGGIALAVNSGKEKTTQYPDVAGEPERVREISSSGFGATLFARYYFLQLGKRFDIYAELGAGFGSMKQQSKQDDVAEEAKMTTIGASADLGINYFITPKIALSFNLAKVLEYSNQKIDYVNGEEGSARISALSGNLNVFQNFFETPTFGLLYKF